MQAVAVHYFWLKDYTKSGQISSGYGENGQIYR